MALVAIGLVLASALAHATWNLLAKRSSDALVFGWWQCLAGTVFVLPVAAFTALAAPPPAAGLPYLGLTAALHCVYFGALAQAYRLGELSLVYPVARGSGLLLTLPAGALLLGEAVSYQALLGALAVLGGLGLAHRPAPPADHRAPPMGNPRGATGLALLTGLAMVGYNLGDKLGVGLVSPGVYILAVFLGPALGLAPFALAVPGRAMAVWKGAPGAIVAAGALAPLAYLLVLMALTISRVSYLAPLREVGLVLGVLMSWVWLGEPPRGHRLAGAALITAGAAVVATAP